MMTQNSVNVINSNTDLSVRIFDNFYRYETNVPASEYDVVNSYFRSVMPDATVAGNFTVSLFQVAERTNISALTLLQNLQGLNNVMEVTLNMAYYLNQIRSLATLLGVNSQVVPNYYAARNVLQ